MSAAATPGPVSDPDAADRLLAALLTDTAWHIEALAGTSAATADALEAIALTLGLLGSPRADRCIERERRRARGARALARELDGMLALGYGDALVSPGAEDDMPPVESRLGAASSEGAVWHLLIDVRAWNLRRTRWHRRRLEQAAAQAVPLLRADSHPAARTAADALAALTRR